MANYFLNDDGSLTKKKKKVKGKSYVMDASGRITLESSDEIAPVKTTKKKEEKRKWFDTGAFDNGYQFGDLTKTIVGTANDIQSDAARGVARIGEGLIDTGAYLAGGTAKLFGNDDFSDDMKKFIARDLNEEYHISDRTSNNTTIGAINNIINGNFKALNPFGEEAVNKENFEKNSVLGDKSDGVVQSAGQLLGTVALQSVGVPWFLTTGTTSFGGEVEQAFNKDATYGEAGVSGLISAGAEILTEKISGGISFGGKTLDDVFVEPLTKKISSKVVRNITKLGIDATGEGFEEVVSEVIGNIGKKLTYEDEKTWNEMLLSEEAMDSYIESFIGGFALGGGANIGKTAYSIKTGRDYNTGLTENEQKVIDTEINNRTTEIKKQRAVESRINNIINEREKTFGTLDAEKKKSIKESVMKQLDNGEINYDSTKLSKKELSEIQKEVENDLKKGNLDIETIESTLSSDKVAQIKALNEQLSKKTTNEQQKAEIQAKINELTDAKNTELKSMLSKDLYLQNSYREANLKKEKFTYEAQETDSEYRKTLAEEFKNKANNTTKSHETFEMLAKLSEDRQTQYHITNNTELAELGYDVEGKDVNGLVVNENGISRVLINIDSNKALNRIVGHETTHLLEGTKEYTELQEMVKEYAETKGDYNELHHKFTRLYAGKNANIENEVTSELVGDYLFTDEQFVNNLSVQKPNIFQKIYNEIKHLYKMATAGSKEARQLEKVKHAFDKAYKQNASKTSETGTKYSISEDGKEITVYHGTSNNAAMRIKKYGLIPASAIGATGIEGDAGSYNYFTNNQTNAETYKTRKDRYTGRLLRVKKTADMEIDDRIRGHKKGEYDFRTTRTISPDEIQIQTDDGRWTPISNYDLFTDTPVEERVIDKSKVYDDDYNNVKYSLSEENSYRGSHQIENARKITELDLNDIQNRVIEVNGYLTKQDYSDLNKLKKIFKAPNENVKIYRASPVNELNSGDWVTTDKAYAKNVANENGGKVYEYEINPSQLYYPDNVKELPSLHRLSSFQYIEDENIRYSLTDNQGRELTKEQQEYFKDSKVRDDNGNLKIVYHGSNVTDITVFKKDKFGDVGINFLTDDPDIADTYRKKSGRRYEFYADIKNPLVIDGEGKNWNDILVGDNPVAEKMYNSLTESEKTYLTDLAKKMNDTYSREDAIEGFYQRINAYDEGLYDRLSEVTGIRGKIFDAALNDWSDTYAKDLLGKRKNTNQLVREAYDSGNYDGVIFKNIVDRGMNFHKAIGERVSNVYVTFNSNQIKNIDNTNPTTDDDIRYSLGNQEQAPVRGDVFGSDIKLQVEEAIAPLKEEIAELKEELAPTVEETYKPTTMDDLEGWETQTREDLSNIERDIAPIETEQTYDYMPDTISMDKKSLNELSKNIKKELNLNKVQTAELESIIQEISNSEIATKEDLFNAIQERFSKQTIEYKNEEVASLKSFLRNYPINVSSYIKAEFKDGFNKVRQKNFNKLKFNNNGLEVDVAYQELSSLYPAYFPDDITNAQDQLNRIIEVANYDVVDIEDYVIPEESIQEITDYIYDSIQDYKLDQHIKSGEEARKLPIDESLIPPVVNDSNTQINKDNAPIRRNVDWDSIEDTSKGKQVTFNEETQALEEEDLVKKTKKELRKALLGTEAQKEFITNALDNAKNRSMALMNNTDTIRNTELVFGRDAGKVINELIFQKEIDNEADSIAWQNKERQEIKDLGIKARSKESAAVQKYGEKQYVNDAGEVFAYGDTELANEFSDVATQEKIKKAAQVIRNKYDNYIDRANDVLTKLGFDPIPKRKDYMRHFQELTDVFSNFGIPFNAKSMAEHVLPTDINGLTENWSPQKNYFASMQRRKGLKTNYDAITGVDGYIGGIANLIYHTEDIQRGRAFEELIRETYGEDKGFENLENLPDELKQARAEKIQDNHLSNYAAWLHEWTNHVAGKKSKIDRSVESMFGRKAFSFLDNARKQVGSNMIGFNLSSSLTNLIAPVQAAAKTNKLAVLKGTADTIKNIFVKDSFMDNNKFLTSRMGSDMISKNAWQKIQDAGFIFMKGMDWFSSNQIVRSKYYELRAKGMSETEAHAEAGKFAARILGDRTKGANAQLYNSKLVGLVTQFQLEVNNQLYSMFYDTYHDSKENAQNNALKTAAGMTFTLGQLFAFTHLFGKTFEAIAGYNPTLDVIGILATALGWGEDDDEEKTTSERLKDAADQLVDALPYVNILTGGGRIPVASGIPNLVGVATGGKDEYGNELTLEDELKKLLFLLPPTGGNQVKKTTQGLAMFDEDLPVKGSYTDSGNLRYPVEDTTLNRVQAALFGQYANKNAKDYFDNERAPLKEKQIQEYKDLGMPISDYWEYRDGLKKQKTTEEKFNYINSLNATNEQKNIMINNVVDRKEAVDMSNYGAFGSYEEFDFATKNPEKYKVIQQIGSFDNYITYQKYISDIKERYSSEKGYSTAQRKAAVQQYIESLNLSIPQKIMLEKMAGGYSIKGYEEYMYGYIESLNMTAKEKQALHDELFN